MSVWIARESVLHEASDAMDTLSGVYTMHFNSEVIGEFCTSFGTSNDAWDLCFIGFGFTLSLAGEENHQRKIWV